MAGSDRERDGQDAWETEPAPHEATEEDQLDTGELPLADDQNDRLPWLEADDDEPEEVSSGKILGLVLLGLVALAVIVGGIWWASNRTPDPTLVADGSTIEAPEGDYKQAPSDPGGKTFDGTGNTAFAVSEGQNRPARLGEASPPVPGAPTAGLDESKAPPPPPGKAPAAAPAPAPAAGAPGTLVQVGAYSTRASAEAAWSRLVQRHEALSGVRHQVVEGTADIGTVFRLQAMAGDASAAQTLCGRLKAGGLACQVK
jgi:hypothetical protein